MNISASSGMQQMQSPMKTQAMSAANKEAASEIIAKYDPSSASQSDMDKMKEAFKDAGITPSRELGKMMSDAGFEKPEGPQGGGKPQGPPPGGGGKQVNGVEITSETEDLYASLLEALDSDDEDTAMQLATKITGDSSLTGIFIDEKA